MIMRPVPRSIRCSARWHDPSAERQADNVPVDKLPEAYAKAIGDADSGAVAPVLQLPGAGTRDQFVIRAGHGPPPSGRHSVRRRARSHSRAARPAARRPPVHRQPAPVDVRGRAVLTGEDGEDGEDGAGRFPAATGDHAGGPSRHRPRDRGARAGGAGGSRHHGRRGRGPDRGRSGGSAGRRRNVGPRERRARGGDRARVIRAGRLAGHAVETAVKLALGG